MPCHPDRVRRNYTKSYRVLSRETVLHVPMAHSMSLAESREFVITPVRGARDASTAERVDSATNCYVDIEDGK